VAETKRLKSQIVTSSSDEMIPDISPQIIELRGQRVLLSQQLAALYIVETKVLMQQVQRNLERFPEDFMFQITQLEFEHLKSQFVTSSWGGIRKMPYAFTEQGIAMLSSVLRSDRAVAVNIEIMRTFVKLRGMMAEHVDLKRKLNALEKKYDGQFKIVFEAIASLMEEPTPPKKRSIGFVQDK
jgi:ORF6N domain